MQVRRDASAPACIETPTLDDAGGPLLADLHASDLLAATAFMTSK
jgi:hypothetical protein